VKLAPALKWKRSVNANSFESPVERLTTPGAENRADTCVAEAAGWKGSTVARADVAGRAGSPAGNSRASKRGRIHAFRGVLVRGHSAGSGHAIRELLTTIDGAGSGAGGVAAAETGSNEGAALQEEDVRKTLAANGRVEYGTPIATERAATTEWQIVERGGDPTMAACAINLAVVQAAIVTVGDARAAILISEALLMRLIVGAVFGQRVGRVGFRREASKTNEHDNGVNEECQVG
jgi:hypothetical protein